MSAAHTSKIRIYDLAKELKMESKRLIEEVRREGVDADLVVREALREPRRVRALGPQVDAVRASRSIP